MNAGIAALASDDGQENGQRGPFGNSAFEQPDHTAGEKRRDQIDGEPLQALGKGYLPRRARAFFAGKADHQLHVFRRFALQDIKHLVRGDDANQLAIAVQHRHR